MIRVVRFSILILVTIIAMALIPTTAVYADATHVVRAGETLSAIAARYGTTVGAIQAANGLSNPNQIIAGMALVIPGAAYSQSSGSAAPGYSSGYAPAQPGYNYVPPATNSLPPPGGGYPYPKSAVCTNPYQVQPGDGLSGIAARCGVSSWALASANGLSPYAMLRVGQILIIPTIGSYFPPGGGQATATPALTRTSTYYPTLPATDGNNMPPATPTPPPGRPWVAEPTPTPRIEPPLEWR